MSQKQETLNRQHQKRFSERLKRKREELERMVANKSIKIESPQELSPNNQTSLKIRFRIKSNSKHNGDCQIIEKPANKHCTIHSFFKIKDSKKQEVTKLSLTQIDDVYKLKEGEQVPYFFMNPQQKKENILMRNVEKLKEQRHKRRLEDKEFFSGRTLNPFFLQHRNFTNVSSNKEKKVTSHQNTFEDIPYFPLISHVQYSKADFTIKDLQYRLEFHNDYDDYDEEISVGQYNDKVVSIPKFDEMLERDVDITEPMPICNEKKDSGPWIHQYAPSSHKDMCGNEEWFYFIYSWLFKWKQWLYKIKKSNKRNHSHIDLHNTLLIHGPCGIGKTSSIYACSKELGFTVIEVNASNHRSGHYIKNLLGEAMQSHRMANSQEDISLILFDEIDIVYPQDKGFYNTLIDLIESSKRPIILICNSITNQISSKLLKNKKVLGINIQKPHIHSIVNILNNILKNENKEIDNNDLMKLVYYKQGDIRSCINDLQFWSPMDLSRLPIRIPNEEKALFLRRSNSSHLSPHIFKDFLRTEKELWWVFSNRLIGDESHEGYDFNYECERLCNVISELFRENMINFYQLNGQLLFFDPLYPFMKIFGENGIHSTNKELDHLRHSLFNCLLMTKDVLSVSDVLIKSKHNKTGKMDPNYYLYQLISEYIMKINHFSLDNMKQLIGSTSFKFETDDNEQIQRSFDQKQFILPYSFDIRKDQLCQYLVDKNINYKTRYKCYLTEYFPFIKQFACIENERRINNTKRRYVPIFDWSAMNVSNEVFNELIVSSYSHLSDKYVQ